MYLNCILQMSRVNVKDESTPRDLVGDRKEVKAGVGIIKNVLLVSRSFNHCSWNVSEFKLFIFRVTNLLLVFMILNTGL